MDRTAPGASGDDSGVFGSGSDSSSMEGLVEEEELLEVVVERQEAEIAELRDRNEDLQVCAHRAAPLCVRLLCAGGNHFVTVAAPPPTTTQPAA